ncbi:hypothetical protein RRG08_022308 [Elysia crispata]|uniref:CDK-activating kinase assembly factor MAT1 n=1 Tax=Elysia crispata TaxID=231223 RepID=A0AAE0ZQD9_9GAST|nr:hypothetical protein RRG08_022308 [Elysia crispata]
MDEQGCPRCKTTKYRNPSLKLLVNVCGHSLCESCVDLLFVKGSGVCPECNTSLRRTNFRLQLFEDPFVEKEIDIRRKVLRDYNKKEEDFATLEDYNDYLETIETIVYNLSNHINIDETKRMIEQYKKDNREQIKKNQSKLSKDEEMLESLIEQEQQETLMRKAMIKQDEQREKAAKRKHKDDLIDDLMFSELSAQAIITSYRESAKQEEEEFKAKSAATAFSTGIKIGHQNNVVPMSRTEQGVMYRYCPLVMEWCGPDPPSMDDIYSDGYLKNIRLASDAEKAGGFREAIACHRALQEAFCGLFSYPTISPSPLKQPALAASMSH